jgi:hypothetical protein
MAIRPVWFSHSAPMNMATHLRMFGPWVEFGRDCDGIVLEAGDLERPLPTSDAAMARHVKQYLDPMLAQTHATMSERVRGLVLELLVSRSASAEEVASRLGMDRRTLHRHLARDGETSRPSARPYAPIWRDAMWKIGDCPSGRSRICWVSPR